MAQTPNRRNFLLPVTVLAMLVASFFAFKYYQAINAVILPVTADTTKCGPCKAYNNVGPNTGKMDMNLVKTMAYNFQNRSGTLAQETRSVWLSLETIKNFIYQIESKSCACDSALGLRIYFGKYPDDNGWKNIFNSDLDPDPVTGLRGKVMATFNGVNKYENINTIFLVPTIRYNNINNDFDPADPNGCSRHGYDTKYNTDNHLVEVKGLATAVPYFTTHAFGSPITALMVQNHGDACPPVPPTMATCPEAGANFDF